MRHRSFIVLATLLGLLIFGAVGVYAYDASREDTIAKGVTIAGVDVGGMSVKKARQTVADQIGTPLQQTVRVRYGRRSFRLDPADAKVRADVDGMVQEALDRSRRGNVVSRVARNLTGGRVDADVPVRVTYDQGAVDDLVKRVERKVERPARNATVEFTGVGVQKLRGHAGVSLRTDALHQAVSDELVHPTADRTVRAHVDKTKPKVGIGDLEDKYPVVVTIDRGAFTLRVFSKLKLTRTYRIAVGQVGLETPAGLYHVQNKAIDPAWQVPQSAWAGKLAGKVIPGGSPENPLKARWLGIYNGAGIHGTDAVGSLGTAASHGCIRMAVPDVIQVYDTVPVGAPVYIA
jgi:lipoprotein-anchoring transpeptidase ErfK/SrfK